MKKIVNSPKGIPEEELDKPREMRVGFDVYVVRPFKPEIVAEDIKRIQQKLQPSLRKNKVVRARAERTGQNIIIL